MKGIVLGLGWQGPVSKQPLGKDAGFLGYVEETEPAEDLEPLIRGRGISASDLFTHNIRGDEIEGHPRVSHQSRVIACAAAITRSRLGRMVRYPMTLVSTYAVGGMRAVPCYRHSIEAAFYEALEVNPIDLDSTP